VFAATSLDSRWLLDCQGRHILLTILLRPEWTTSPVQCFSELELFYYVVVAAADQRVAALEEVVVEQHCCISNTTKSLNISLTIK
jgi:hypothetical protein